MEGIGKTLPSLTGRLRIVDQELDNLVRIISQQGLRPCSKIFFLIPNN